MPIDGGQLVAADSSVVDGLAVTIMLFWLPVHLSLRRSCSRPLPWNTRSTRSLALDDKPRRLELIDAR